MSDLLVMTREERDRIRLFLFLGMAAVAVGLVLTLLRLTGVFAIISDPFMPSVTFVALVALVACLLVSVASNPGFARRFKGRHWMIEALNLVLVLILLGRGIGQLNLSLDTTLLISILWSILVLALLLPALGIPNRAQVLENPQPRG